MNEKPTYQQLEKELATLKEKFNNLNSSINNSEEIDTLSLTNYQFLTQTSKDYILIIDKDLMVRYVNIVNIGVKKSDVIGHSILEFVPVDEQALTAERFERVFKKKESIDYEAEFKDLHGIHHFVSVELFPKIENDEVIGVISVSKDITEKVKIENELKETATLLQDAQKLADLGNWWVTFPENKLSWSQETYRIFGVDPSLIIDSYKTYEQYVSIEDKKKIDVDFEESIKNGKDYVSEHIIKLRNGTEKWVIERGRPIFNEKGECVKMIGTVQDITDRKINEIATRVKEEKYRSLFENNPVALLEQDFSYAYQELMKVKAEGVTDIAVFMHENPKTISDWLSKNKILDVNKAAVKLFKAKNKADLKDIEKVFIQDSFPHLAKVINSIFHKKTEVIDESVVLQDFKKNKIVTLIKINLNYQKDRLVAAASITDITSRVNAENELKASEENFKLLSNIAVEGVLIHNKGVAITMNTAFSGIFGYEPSELVGKDLISLVIAKEDISLVSKKVKESIAKPYEVHGIKKNGEKFLIELESRDIKTGKYAGARVTAIRDLTERQEALQQNKLLTTALEQSSNTIVITKTNGQIEYVNPQFTKVSGYTFDEAVGQNSRILNSGQQSKEYYKSMWETISSGHSWEGEFSNISKDNQIFWESVRISPITNNNGKIVNYLAIKEDISERKNIEEKLAKSRIRIETSEKKFRSLFEKSGDPSLIIKNGIFKECNQAAIEMLGYKSTQGILNRHPSALSPETQPGGKKSFDLSNELMKQCLENGTNRFEWVHLKENGEQVPTEVLLTTISNKPGKIIIHAVWRDISMQKDAAKALVFKNKELSMLSKSVELKNELLLTSKMQLQNVIEQSPVALWQENYKSLIQLIEEQKLKTPDMRAYIDTHPEFVELCLSKIELINVNDTALTLFGKKTKLELTDYLASTFNEVSYRSFKEGLVALSNGEREFSGETQYVNADGGIIYAMIKMAIIDDDYNCIVSTVDVSDIKKAEIEILRAKELAEEKEANFRALFSSINDGIVVADVNRRITDCNPALRHMFGYTLDEIEGQFTEVLYENESQYKELGKGITENLGNKTAFNKTINYRKKNDDVFPGDTSVFYLKNEKQEVIGLIGLIRDVSEKVEHQKTITAQNQELVIQKEKAEESNRLKTEFLNNMSHEIRTPMNGILGFTQFLNEPGLSDQKRNYYVSIIENSGAQLLHVIDDILEISKLGTKQVKVIDSQVNINNTLLELFSIFDVKAKEVKIPLFFKKGLEDKESEILTDKTKLIKILGNLLENALKFTSEGFIEFGYELVGTDIEFYVKDTGIGIAKNKQEIIFERFSQAEKGLSRKVGGLGLGLSIAKENSELLGGSIRVDSDYGKGTTFFVTIPFKPTYVRQGMSVKQEPKPADSNQFTILVAEDEEINYLYIEILLGNIKDYKFKILHAKNGEEAVSYCKKEQDIHLVLMDLKMPILDGFQATKEIKSFLPDLPVIAQTAYSTAAEKQVAMEAGCDDFISKPIDKAVFNKVIRKFIAQL